MITLSSTALGIDEGSTTLEGVSAIKWSKKRKVESNYGMGGKPVSRGFGYMWIDFMPDNELALKRLDDSHHPTGLWRSFDEEKK